MDNQRLLIWGFFGLMLFMTWQAWLEDYGPQPTATPPAASAPLGPPANGVPDDALPELATDAETPALSEPQQAPLPATPQAAATTAPLIEVETDVLSLTLSSQGGTVQSAALKNYPVEKDRPDELVQLLSPAASDYGVIQVGLRAASEAHAEPNHLVNFSSEQRNYELQGETLTVPLTWVDDSGLRVERVYRFTRGSYIVGVEQRVINGSDAEWRGASYAQIRRRSQEPERSMFDVDTYSFDGPIIYDGEKSEKLDRDDLIDDGPYRFRAATGWIASIQHHFLSAIVPARGEEQSYSVAVRDNVATSSAIGSAQAVAPGAEASFAMTLFVGPKLQAQLEEVDETLKLTVDYGWLTIISQPLFWLLSFVYGFVSNWGLAIIVVTILIKLAFYKLTEASGRSMAKMREIQPRMKALQDRYKDDRQALSQAMMELYKREKVNPAAGCLPILIQMPFFLAFYWVLLESVEMRQAPFALWITDLSSKDPFFILPLIMGASMLFQQKLNPAPADPVQAKVMQIMPIMFTAFFAFFPSGLVLYWVTNTLLSIAQQWHINKVVAEEGKQPRKSAKTKANKSGKKN